MKIQTESTQVQTDEVFSKGRSGKAVYEKIKNSTRYNLIQMVSYTHQSSS